MPVLPALALFAAAFAAGAINAVAGGGSLISFPALLAAGLPSKVANVTNTVALWPGYVGGSYAYRSELRHQRWRLVVLALPSIAGALVGSAILLATPQSVFDIIVPFLIVFACGALAFQDRLSALADRRGLGSDGGDHIPPALHVATFLLAIYGAYFGAALGILLLAALGVLLPDDIHYSNALKGMLSLVINAVAVIYFAFFGPVAWLPAAVMAIGAIAGGYSGVGIARRLGQRWLRIVVIAYGLTAAAILFARLLMP